MGIAWFVPPVRKVKELARKTWALRMPICICILLTNAPDIDYLFGIPWKNLNLYHQTATHTVAWGVVLAASLWMFGWPGKSWHSFLFLILLVSSHVATDYLTSDNSKPYGMMLGWPLCTRHFLSPFPIFPSPAKNSLVEIFTRHNFKVVLTEILLTLPLVAIVAAFKLKFPVMLRSTQQPGSTRFQQQNADASVKTP